jgi:hypothetical protein
MDLRHSKGIRKTDWVLKKKASKKLERNGETIYRDYVIK